MIRRKCIIEDCNRLGRNKGNYKEKTVYDLYCDRHHRLRTRSLGNKLSIDNKKCENCGWEKAYCDRHRKVKERGYYRENVIVLCPNCHRLATLGLLLFT